MAEKPSPRKRITAGSATIVMFDKALLGELHHAEAEAMVRDASLCRPCLRSVEKLVKVRKELRKYEEL